MKVFISVDMEGVSGITDPEDVLPDGADYQRGRVFMTGDANAAIVGAYDGGADEVLVNDSHWIMRNLLLERLDPRARTIKGFHKSLCMVQGSAPRSTARSSWVPLLRRDRGRGAQPHPPRQGDPECLPQRRAHRRDPAERRLRRAFRGAGPARGRRRRGLRGGPAGSRDVETVAVKDGIDKFTANCLHPQVAQERIREATARALAGPTGSSPTCSTRPTRSGSSGTPPRSRPRAPSSPGSG